MKNKFYTFGLILACLLALFIASCSQDDTEETSSEIVTPPTPMEQLTGKYTLASLEMNVDAVGVVLESPAIFGDLTLGASGGSWSMTFVATETGLSENVSGDRWSASATTLTLAPDPPETYTWDGTYLTLTGVTEGIELTLKWQKL